MADRNGHRVPSTYSERNTYLEHQLRTQDRQTKELQHEHGQTREELRRVRDINSSLLKNNQDITHTLVTAIAICIGQQRSPAGLTIRF